MSAQPPWILRLPPVRERLHVERCGQTARLDLTKEQRDEHIRRYAELLEAKVKIPVVQNEPVEIGYGKPPPKPKGIARQIADETGLSKSTVQRALNPKPPGEVVPISARSEQDAVLAQPFPSQLMVLA